MKLVVIESPFAGAVKRNVQYARDLMLFCLQRGEAPIASHLLYPQCLDDDRPDERALGIEAGLLWAKHAEKTVVGFDYGLSRGMTAAIARSRAEGRPVEWVSILDSDAEPESALSGEPVTYGGIR